jgi:hypothetical protein
MGKKSAHSGMSPKDRSINLMDKFITRNANRAKGQPALPERRKDASVPVNLWPLKDQIEYWENRSDLDRFDEDYTSYATWYAEIKKISNIYPQTFVDFTMKLKPELNEMFDKKMSPKSALIELRKLGVY